METLPLFLCCVRQAKTTAHSASDDNSSPNAQSDQEAREMLYYNSLLQKLLSVISNGEEESVAHVISTIRSGASHDQILETIDQLTENAGRTNGAGNGA